MTKKKQRPYDYQHAILMAWRYVSTAGPEKLTKRIMRRLVRDAVRMKQQTHQTVLCDEADRIAKELIK